MELGVFVGFSLGKDLISALGVTNGFLCHQLLGQYNNPLSLTIHSVVRNAWLWLLRSEVQALGTRCLDSDLALRPLNVISHF